MGIRIGNGNDRAPGVRAALERRIGDEGTVRSGMRELHEHHAIGLLDIRGVRDCAIDHTAPKTDVCHDEERLAGKIGERDLPTGRKGMIGRQRHKEILTHELARLKTGSM